MHPRRSGDKQGHPGGAQALNPIQILFEIAVKQVGQRGKNVGLQHGFP
jgi:hypothetical protein